MASMADTINGVAVRFLSYLGMQLQPERLDHFQYSRKIGHTFAGKRFVQTFPAQAGALSHLGHPLRTGNVAQCFGDKSRIAAALLNTGIQVERHFFRCSQLLSNVVAERLRFSLCHDVLLKIFSQCKRGIIIRILTIAGYLAIAEVFNYLLRRPFSSSLQTLHLRISQSLVMALLGAMSISY